MNNSFIDITGQRYGRWTVLRPSSKGHPNSKLWECVCDCGTKKDVKSNTLRDGRSKSCGCLVSVKAKKCEVGIKYNRLTVVEFGYKKGNLTFWRCVCECGNIVTVENWQVLKGGTKSCGCLVKDIARRHFSTHGRTETKEYTAWLSMKARCLHPNQIEYVNYGGRGIAVCDRWLASFENFFNDMGEAPSSKHSVDRIDNNGNYEPSNCRWATFVQQCNNRRSNRIVVYRGESKTMTEWCKELGLNRGRTWYRLKKGWSIDEAFEKPKQLNGFIAAE